MGSAGSAGGRWRRRFLRWGHRQVVRSTFRQFYEIGTKSTLVIMITGAFVGAVLAVQAVPQFKAMGLVSRMGTVVNLSVLRELGPVLAGIMLAGRVGGGLTAELGTMRVTEQIDAFRAMGADPIRVLVVPRFLACLLLIPVLAMYASFMGILGGFATSVYLFGASPGEFWIAAAESRRRDRRPLRPDQVPLLRGGYGADLLLHGFHLPPRRRRRRPSLHRQFRRLLHDDHPAGFFPRHGPQHADRTRLGREGTDRLISNLRFSIFR